MSHTSNKDGRRQLTVVFTVPAHPQTPSLDGGEAETDCLAQSRSINMGDAILVAHTAIRKIETLTRNIAIWVGSIVGTKPDVE